MTPPALPTDSPVITRRLARTVMLLNLFGTPGLGTLMARQWGAGVGQLLVAGAGFLMVMGWLVRVLINYYSLISGATPPPQSHWLGIVGGILFIIAWLWSLVTSLVLMNEASRPPPLR